MSKKDQTKNLLELDLDWLERLLDWKSAHSTKNICKTNNLSLVAHGDYFQPEVSDSTLELFPAPLLQNTHGEGSFYDGYYKLVKFLSLNEIERLLVTLSIAAQICPEMLKSLNESPDNTLHGLYSERGKLFPTVDTVLYLMNLTSRKDRLSILRSFQLQSPLVIHDLLGYDESTTSFYASNQLLSITCFGQFDEFHESLNNNEDEKNREDNSYFEKDEVGESKPLPLVEALTIDESLMGREEFKVDTLTTELNLSDHLSLQGRTWKQLEGLLLRIEKSVIQNINPSYRCVFRGETGSGKTLTAILLARYFHRQVRCINTSQVFSTKFYHNPSEPLKKFFEEAQASKDVILIDKSFKLIEKDMLPEISPFISALKNFKGVVIFEVDEIPENSILKQASSLFSFDDWVLFPAFDYEQQVVVLKNLLEPFFDLASNTVNTFFCEKYPMDGHKIRNIVNRMVGHMSVDKSQSYKSPLNHAQLHQFFRRYY